jgi:peroxiredoxin
MSERKRFRPVWFLFPVAWLAGCGQAPVSIPHVDYSSSSSYAVEPFKDDAPTNTSVDPAAFPLSFIDHHGQPVDLSKFRGQKKVVLVVLRGMPQSPGGQFCPSCLAQASSLLAQRQKFTERGAEVLLVYPGPTDRLGEFLQTARMQTPGEPQQAFRVLLDEECRACDRLGIRADLAKPSTYVLDTRGNLVYAYVGATSTDRPSIQAILAQLDKAN